MTSREAILCALAHKQPDFLPLDLGATTSSGISAIAYSNLKKHLGINEGHIRVYDVVQQVAKVEPVFMQRYGVDTLDIGYAFNDSDSDWKDVTLPSGLKVQFPIWFNYQIGDNGSLEVFNKEGDKLGMMPDGATFFDQSLFPYADDLPNDFVNLEKARAKVLWNALANSPWDRVSEKDFYANLRKRTQELRENTDKALVFTCGGSLFESGTYLRRIDNFLMDIYTEQEKVERLLDALLESHISLLEKVCESVGDLVDVVRFNDDLGMDSGGFMSPAVYKSLFKPRHRQLCDFVKANSGMKILLHSCGSIYELLPYLIEAGFDIINPIQTTARDMDPQKLKKEFGQDVTFWGGGCNTRYILNHGKPEEVYDYTRRVIDVFFVDGGYVFNQEHNILPDVPPQNIEAMMKAVGEYKHK
jgi:uroporphyrinogen decarboxylase